MKSWMWVKSALAAATLMTVTTGHGHAQNPAPRTALARVYEIIDEHFARASKAPDSGLRRRLEIEAYLALLSLPAGARQYEAADRLRRIRDAAPLERTPDNEVIGDGIDAATRLAGQRYDFERLSVINRQYYGLTRTGIESPYVRRLVSANDPQALAWFLQTLQPGVGEPAGLANRHVELDWLCRVAPHELVRQVALLLTEPEVDDFVAPLLAELGESADAERRADHQMQPGKRWSVGTRIIGQMVVLASRRGDSPETQRLARKLIDAGDPDDLFAVSRNIDVAPGACGGKLRRSFIQDWLVRSVFWLSAYPVNDESQPPSSSRSLADAVAAALASVGGGVEAIGLIDRMIGLLDRNLQDKGIDEANLAILTTAPDDRGTYEYAQPARFWGSLRQALRRMRVVAGAPIDEAVARDLRFGWFMALLGDFPQSGLPRRVLTFTDDERRILQQANPGLLEKLQFASLVMEGRASEARSLAEAIPAAAQLGDWRLLYPIEMMENAGLADRARKALDAYLVVRPAKDLSVLRLLLAQGRSEQAKAMMREFVAGESGRGGQSEVFLGTMLLREQGDRADIATLMAARPTTSPEEAGQRLIVIADALAWQGAGDEIATAVGRLGRLVSLPAKEEACVRDTLVGLQAVALARNGNLEGGYRLVADRPLERRQFCWPGQGYGSAKPIFDLRYLVQEWARQGHAVP